MRCSPLSRRSAVALAPILPRAAAAVLACAGLALNLPAQTPADTPPAARLAPVTGRDFAGLRLPGAEAPQSADVAIAGARAWVWVEDDPATPTPPIPGLAAVGVVQRLLVQGDVKVDLGRHRFTAAQASIWIQQLPDAAPVPPSPPPPPPPAPRDGADVGAAVRTRQFAIYFDRVSDPGADAGFAQAGDRLLVTGVLTGETALRIDAIRRGRPEISALTRDDDDALRAAAAFTVEGEHRLARHMRRLLGLEDDPGAASPPPGLVEPADLAAAGPGADVYAPLKPIRPGLSRVYEPNSPLASAEAARIVGAAPPIPLPPVNRIEPLFAERGVVSFSAGNNRLLAPDGAAVEDEPIRLVPGAAGEDNTVLLSGGVLVQYADARQARNLQISAQRAVVFLQPGPIAQLTTFGKEAVKGVYLEGGVVATDGRYTLRGPKIYYDFIAEQAVMVDGVFWTFDELRGLPLYVRAREIRQLAANQWQARGARLATTSFFDPVFSIGASSVTITRRTEPGAVAAGARPAGPIHDPAPRGPAANMNPAGFEAPPDDDTIAGGLATGPVPAGRGLWLAPQALRAGGIVVGPGEPDEAESTFVDASGITLRAGGVPFFYVPRFKGDINRIPLRQISIENSSGSGAALKTAWDIFSIAGVDPPYPRLESLFLLDWYFDRGPGVGTRTTWGSPVSENQGSLLAYTLPIDFGRDSLSSGLKVGRDHEFRGMILAEHTQRLSERWTLQLEGSLISDENFVDAFFKPLGYQGREFTNSAYLKHQDDTNLFYALAKGELNDFTPNHYLLQSQGFNVDKLPEAAYFRVADDLLPQAAPGMLIWSHEYRLSRVQFNFTEPTAAELGFSSPARARAAFGFTDPNLSPGDALRAAGFSESAVLRADTRQELTSTFNWGAFKITPFLTGRFTAYDTEFENFNPSGAPHGEEQYRYWYAGGVRASTQITRIDDSVENRLLDLHRIRHIIEPGIALWYAGSNLSQNDLPTYDDQVESIATGAVANFNIAQTWQTKRGGPGRWRNVDVLKLNTGITGSTDDADPESPLKRFFTYRPEYSQLGDFANIDAAWQVTDVVGLTFDHIYDLDTNQPARTSAGGTIQHSPDFSSYAEVRYINALDATYVNFGADLRLTRRYTLGFHTTYDTDRDEFQSYSAALRRKVPEAVLGLTFAYSEISDEASVGLIFEPSAANDRAVRSQRLQGLGR